MSYTGYWIQRIKHLVLCLFHQIRWLIGAIVIHSIEGMTRVLINPVIQTVLQIVLVVGAIAYLLILIRNKVLRPIGTIEYSLTETIDSIESAIESIANVGSSVVSFVTQTKSNHISFGDFDLTRDAYADLLKEMPTLCYRYADVFTLSRAAWNLAHSYQLCHIARYVSKSSLLSSLFSVIAPQYMYDLKTCTITRMASFCFWTGIPYLLMGGLEVILALAMAITFHELFTDIFITVPTLVLLDVEFILFKSPSKLLQMITLLSRDVSELSPFAIPADTSQ